LGCTRQAALNRQDLSYTYLAHHELESVVMIMIITINIITIIIVIIVHVHHIYSTVCNGLHPPCMNHTIILKN